MNVPSKKEEYQQSEKTTDQMSSKPVQYIVYRLKIGQNIIIILAETIKSDFRS